MFYLLKVGWDLPVWLTPHAGPGPSLASSHGVTYFNWLNCWRVSPPLNSKARELRPREPKRLTQGQTMRYVMEQGQTPRLSVPVPMFLTTYSVRKQGRESHFCLRVTFVPKNCSYFFFFFEQLGAATNMFDFHASGRLQLWRSSDGHVLLLTLGSKAFHLMLI